MGLQRRPYLHAARHPRQPQHRRARTRIAALGLVPFFAVDLKAFSGFSTINARAENITSSRTYREPFKKRRCLVPASGFYEWRRSGDPLGPKKGQVRVPYGFDLVNGHMMAFAGLWDAWKDPANGAWLQSYTVITTEANELMALVHDRMPVILHPRDFDRWLDREPTHQPPIDLLRPFPAEELQTFALSKDVGSVRNNSPDLLESD